MAARWSSRRARLKDAAQVSMAEGTAFIGRSTPQAAALAAAPRPPPAPPARGRGLSFARLLLVEVELELAGDAARVGLQRAGEVAERCHQRGPQLLRDRQR